MSRLEKTGPGAGGVAESTRTWVMTFARGTKLIGNVIKVRGSMQAEAVKNGHGETVLRVRTNYLFVYAVAEPGVPASLMRVVSHELAVIDFAPWDDPGGPLEAWYSVGPSAIAGSLCGTLDGYVHPQFPQTQDGRVKPSGTPVDPYALNAPPPGKCMTTTGT